MDRVLLALTLVNSLTYQQQRHLSPVPTQTMNRELWNVEAETHGQ